MQSAKETASNVAASAKAGMEKTKATLQEKGEKMTTRDPLQKEMATEKKDERIYEAERQKQAERQQNAAAKQQAAAGGGTGILGSHGPSATTTTGTTTTTTTTTGRGRGTTGHGPGGTIFN